MTTPRSNHGQPPSPKPVSSRPHSRNLSHQHDKHDRPQDALSPSSLEKMRDHTAPVSTRSSALHSSGVSHMPVDSSGRLHNDDTTPRSKAYSLEALAQLSATLPADRRAHLATTGKQLLHAWRNNKFCDVIIKAEHSLFYAHLEVFVAFTDYFDEEIPLQRKQRHINLGLDVKPDDAATILKYLYFGELQADAENVYGVWTIARALKIHDIDEACTQFIERLLTATNLIFVLEFCEQRNVTDLCGAAYDRFILMFYEQVADESFLEWDVDKVARLFGCDDMKIKTELDLYVAMKRWIDHKRFERMANLESLVELIRFAHMSRDEIVQCTLLDPSFLEIHKVKELLATANWYITMQQSGRHWSEFQLPKPRHPPKKSSHEPGVSAHRPASIVTSSHRAASIAPSSSPHFISRERNLSAGSKNNKKLPTPRKAITDNHA